MATLLELIVCGDSPHAMQQAQSRKGGREDYLAISSHLQAIVLKSTYHTVEITSLGHSNAATSRALKEMCQASDTPPLVPQIVRQLLTDCAKIAISCSPIIFFCAEEQFLGEQPPLQTVSSLTTFYHFKRLFFSFMCYASLNLILYCFPPTCHPLILIV